LIIQFLWIKKYALFVCPNYYINLPFQCNLWVSFHEYRLSELPRLSSSQRHFFLSQLKQSKSILHCSRRSFPRYKAALFHQADKISWNIILIKLKSSHECFQKPIKYHKITSLLSANARLNFSRQDSKISKSCTKFSNKSVSAWKISLSCLNRTRTVFKHIFVKNN